MKQNLLIFLTFLAFVALFEAGEARWAPTANLPVDPVEQLEEAKNYARLRYPMRVRKDLMETREEDELLDIVSRLVSHMTSNGINKQ